MPLSPGLSCIGQREILRLTLEPVPRSHVLIDLDELDVEDQVAVDGSLPLIGERLGDPESHFLAFDHQLDTFSPPRYHTAERERRRLAIRERAVEQFAVSRPA